MTLVLRLACLWCLASLSFAMNISGWLVSSKCFASVEGNRGDIPSYVNWDLNGAIRYCSPNKKTKSFTVVEQNDGLPFKFDAAGNEKALALGLNASKEFAYMVKVEGLTSRNTLAVQTISIVRRVNRQGKGAPGL